MMIKRRIMGNKVDPLQPEQIREIAESIRAFMLSLSPRHSEDGYVNIVDFIEELHNRELIELEVCESSDLPHDYANATPSQKKVSVRQEVYHQAARGEARARFTMAHELGHLVLHANVIPKYAQSQAPSSHHYTEDVEWQANEFAAWLLVSPQDPSKLKTPKSIADNFGVSLEMAGYQWRKLKEAGYI